MELKCPGCHRAYAADDVSLGTGVAKCRFCDRVYQIPTRSSEATDVRTRIVKNLADPPSSVKEVSDIEGTKLSYKAGWAGGCGLLGFAIFWDGFLVFWYAMAFSSNAPPMMFIFPLLHVAVGVGITWAALAQIFNRTTITLSGDRLSIATTPLSLAKKREFSSSEFRQLFVSRNPSTASEGAKTYELHMMRHDGQSEAILKGIHDLNSAIYLERRIESYFAISDEVVPGEVGTED